MKYVEVAPPTIRFWWCSWYGNYYYYFL